MTVFIASPVGNPFLPLQTPCPSPSPIKPEEGEGFGYNLGISRQVLTLRSVGLPPEDGSLYLPGSPSEGGGLLQARPVE